MKQQEFYPLGGGSKKIGETVKAINLQWRMTGKYVEDEMIVTHWFPKQFVKLNEYGVWMVAEWLYRKVDNELRPEYQKNR